MEEEIELLEQYLNGELGSPAKEHLETRLETDLALRERLRLLKEMRYTLHHETASFRQVLQDAGDKYFEENKRKSNSNRYVLIGGLAATILLLIISSVLLLSDFSDTNESVFQSYYEVPPENISMRRSGENERLIESLDKYNSGDYRAALTGFNDMLSEKATDEALLFYSSICLIEVEDFNAAANRLKPLAGNQESDYQTAAAWYLGLTFLELGREGEARRLFKTLAENMESSYARKSSEILEQLQ